jgi:acyl-coenzyme A synthetase/AMP-(fatty) acid ligase
MSFVPLRFTSARQRIFFALSRGASVILQPGAASLTDLVIAAKSHKATNIFLTPMHAALICRHSRALIEGASPLLESAAVEISTAPVAPKLLVQMLRALSAKVFVTYASNEVGTVTSTRINYTNTIIQNTYNIGMPLSEVDIALLDDSLQHVTEGSGKIAVRLKNSHLDVSYLTTDGKWISGLQGEWFLPGDVGRFDKDGSLLFEGRSDDMMIFNGINIFPIEIESAALGMKDVLEAASFGVDSEVSGQIPCVALILERDIPTSDLMAAFQQQLGARAPRYIFKMRRLPRNAAGKILRRELAIEAKNALVSAKRSH